MDNILQVKNFNSISLQSNSLILCDIDDTIINYRQETNEYWSNHTKGSDPKYRKWASLICDVPPTFVCSTFEQFYDKVKNTNSELVFVTARDPIHEPMTVNQLEQLGIVGHNIHHLAGSSKGDFIKNTFMTERNVIFIDDSSEHVNDVLNKNPHINVYHLNVIVGKAF